MKISELIEELQSLLKYNGDLEACTLRPDRHDPKRMLLAQLIGDDEISVQTVNKVLKRFPDARLYFDIDQPIGEQPILVLEP